MAGWRLGGWGLGTAPGSAWLPGCPGSLRAQLSRIGIQLYTVRRDLPARRRRAPWPGWQRSASRKWNLPDSPRAPRRRSGRCSDRHGLTAPSGHVPLQALRGDWDRALDDAAAVGQRYIVVAYQWPGPSAGRWTTGSGWRRSSTRRRRPPRPGRDPVRLSQPRFRVRRRSSGEHRIRSAARRDRSEAGRSWSWILYWIDQRRARIRSTYFARWPGRFPLLHVKDMDATRGAAGLPTGGQGSHRFQAGSSGGPGRPGSSTTSTSRT